MGNEELLWAKTCKVMKLEKCHILVGGHIVSTCLDRAGAKN